MALVHNPDAFKNVTTGEASHDDLKYLAQFFPDVATMLQRNPATPVETIGDWMRGKAPTLTNVIVQMVLATTDLFLLMPPVQTTQQKLITTILSFSKTTMENVPPHVLGPQIHPTSETVQSIQSQYALSLVIDADFFKTPEGKARFEQFITALARSAEWTVISIIVRTIIERTYAPWRETIMSQQPVVFDVYNAFYPELRDFGIIQKQTEGLGFYIRIDHLRAMLRGRNKTPDVLVLGPGIRTFVAFGNSVETDASKRGERRALTVLEKGGRVFESFDGMRIIEEKEWRFEGLEDTFFSLLDAAVWVPRSSFDQDFSPNDITTRQYNTHAYRGIVKLDGDTDHLALTSIDSLIRDCARWDRRTGELNHKMHSDFIRERRSVSLQTATLNEHELDLFVYYNEETKEHDVVKWWGQVETHFLHMDTVRMFGRSFRRQLAMQEPAENMINDYVAGLQLIEELYRPTDQVEFSQIEGLAAAVLLLNGLDLADGSLLGVEQQGQIKLPSRDEQTGAIFIGDRWFVRPDIEGGPKYDVDPDSTVGPAADGKGRNVPGNAVRVPDRFYGFGNFMGINSIAGLRGISDGRGWNANDIKTASAFIRAVQWLFREATDSFGRPHELLRAKFLPHYWTTGERDSETNNLAMFGHSVVDSSKFPILINASKVGGVSLPGLADQVGNAAKRMVGASDRANNALERLLAAPQLISEAKGVFYGNDEKLFDDFNEEFNLTVRTPAPADRIFEDRGDPLAQFIATEILSEQGRVIDLRGSTAEAAHVLSRAVELVMENADPARIEPRKTLTREIIREWREEAARMPERSDFLQRRTRSGRSRHAEPLQQQSLQETLGVLAREPVTLNWVNMRMTLHPDLFKVRGAWKFIVVPVNPAYPRQPLFVTDQSAETLPRRAKLARTSMDRVEEFGVSQEEWEALPVTISVFDDNSGTRRPVERIAGDRDLAHEFTPTLVRRNYVVNDGIIHPLERIGALLLIWSRVHRDTIRAWARNNLVVPLNFMEAQPFGRFNTTGMIMAEGGKVAKDGRFVGGAGFTPFSFEDLKIAEDIRKVLFGNFTMRLGAHVADKDAAITSSHDLVREYLGGWGRAPMVDRTDFNADTLQHDGDTFVLAVPYHFQSQDLPTAWDITGVYHMQLLGLLNYEGEHDPNQQRIHYPTAPFYAWYWRLNRLNRGLRNQFAQYHQNEEFLNTLMFRTAQYNWNPVTRRRDVLEASRGHFQPVEYAGLIGDIRQRPQTFRGVVDKIAVA